MDDDMKELSPDKFHLQAKMQEWLEANQEIYTDFKSKIQSILKNLLCDNHSKQIDDEAITLQSIILEVMTTEEGVATDEMIDKFSNAIKDGNMQNTLKKAFMPIGRIRNVKLKKQLTRI